MSKRDVTVRIKEVYVRTITIKDVEDTVPDDTLQYEAHRLYLNGDRSLSEPNFQRWEPLDTWDVWRGAPIEESEIVPLHKDENGVEYRPTGKKFTVKGGIEGRFIEPKIEQNGLVGALLEGLYTNENDWCHWVNTDHVVTEEAETI